MDSDKYRLLTDKGGLFSDKAGLFLAWVKEISCVSDADASYRGKGDVCMSERRYSNDPREISEQPKDAPAD
jgi:hypothetical protein